MDTAINHTFSTLYSFLIGKIPITDFADWVYQNDTLQITIGRVWDTSLLAFNYQAPNAELRLRQLIKQIYQELQPGIDTDKVFWRLDVTDAATAFLNGGLRFIDGANRLCYLCEVTQDSCWDDPDFSVFCLIADQADFIPSASTRAYLSEEALERLKLAETDLEEVYRSKAVAAARQLIERFQLS